MYRLNARGEFNVPYGGGFRTPDVLWKTGLLMKCGLVMRSAEISTGDFEVQLDAARRGDVVYCDPTYTVAHENNGFVRYNERNFSWADQRRLAAACRRAATRGAQVLVSNAYHASIAALYPGALAEIFERRTSVSRLPSGRRLVREYLFTFPT
jgi:DNA adenine methylase